ncbi:probable serine/threonine-protein kinase DDB_G0282963 isoform X2 [Aphidius gifuensis]|nr:probable serine/threonine-protein kinase DDB_G0282963 isoform X2 [Aphidius gifuensis]
MPIPTRSAPKPPGKISQNFDWTNNDPFGPLTFEPQVQKKIPPPRPPPPRFKQNVQLNNSKIQKPTRPTELLGSLFGITTTKKQQQQQQSTHQVSYDQRSSTNNLNSANGLLIDLSPPGSPTFTTRSSDGVSVDSFGSDGNSNPSLFTNSSSGNTSQNESAFDDDFDFFKNINKNKNTTQNDPWKLKDNNGWNQTSFDQFDKLKNSSNNNNKFNDNSVKQIGDSKFFTNNDTTKIHTMPTIIRAKPAKPPLPKILTTSLAPKVTNLQFNSDNNSWKTTASSSSTTKTTASSFNYIDDDINEDDYSPPMPSIPPPAPPTHYLAESNYNTFDKQQPHGIALYDFSASQIGDLSLKKGDKVMIKKFVNNEWLEGQVGNSCGIFPANFIDIIVPLRDDSINIVNALYPFEGETWEDLTFEEGAQIKVLSRISDDWLYGEYKNTKGQFPSNYVDKIPQNLPQYSRN